MADSTLTLLRDETSLFGVRCLLYRHRSGLRVAFLPKERVSTAVYLGVPAGELEEDPAMRRFAQDLPPFPRGTAHFLEHKLFENADGEDTLDKLAAFGANGNAYTGPTGTVYLFTCSEREGVLPALRALLCGFLHPYFTEESVARERDIITQEILLYEDDPETALGEGMYRALFGERSPVTTRVCGSPQSISAVTRKTLLSFYNTFYRLTDVILTLSGVIDIESVTALLDELLPGAPARLPPRGLPPMVALPSVRARTTAEKPLPMPMFCIGLRADPLPSGLHERAREAAALSLFSWIVLDDFLSSLYEKGIVPEEPRSSCEVTDRYSCLSFLGQAQDPEEVRSRFLSHIEWMRRGNISREVFHRGRRVLYAQFLRCFEGSESSAAIFTSCALEGIDLFAYGQALLDTGREKILELAELLLSEDRITLSALYPQKEESKAVAKAPA